MSRQCREFYKEILCAFHLFHKGAECETLFPSSPLPKGYSNTLQKIYYINLYLETGKRIFYKHFFQTSRHVGRKSCQSCLRCTFWLLFEVTVLAMLMVTSIPHGELPSSDFQGCLKVLFSFPIM